MTPFSDEVMALPKTVLQFSGGKDSLACLYLLEKRWPEITVCWVNTGAPFPETVELMRKVHAMVPHFLELKTDQSIESEGFPVDVLPVAATTVGQHLEGRRPYKFQSRHACCAHSRWVPMHHAMQQLGATVVIRGQKRSDAKKGPVVDGHVAGGITYEFPLETWSDADVFAYLKEKRVELPANYRYMTTGLDCDNCTAYLDDNAGRLTFMREHHPKRFEQVHRVLENLVDALKQQTQPLLASLREAKEHG